MVLKVSLKSQLFHWHWSFQADEKFKRIRQNLAGKPYAGHIVQTYYAVENNVEDEDDEQVSTHDPLTPCV